MDEPPIFDLLGTLARLEQDWELFRSLVAVFNEQGPKDLTAIHAAVVAGDAEALVQAAHRLKGAVLQFEAPTILAATRALEEAGRTRRLAGAMTAAACLERDLHRLLRALQQTCEPHEAS